MREKIRRRFEQTQEDSLVTVDELIPVLLLSLNEPEGLDLNLDQLVIEIKGAKDARKRELWNQLTLKSVEKCVWSTYMISSLLLLTRLQLNILTRREYLDSAIKSAVQRESETSNTQYTLVKWVTSAWSAWSSADAGQLQPSPVNVLERNTITRNSYINEQAFLSISWWLLNRGWLRYKTLIQETIRSEFAQLNPKDELTLKEFSDRLRNVFHKINGQLFGEDCSALKEILLPVSTMEAFVLQQTLDPESLIILKEDKTILHQLLGETIECVASVASSIVLENLVNESFHYILNDLESLVAKKKNKRKQQQQQQQEQSLPPDTLQPAEKAAEGSYQMAMFAISCKDCCAKILQNGRDQRGNTFLKRLNGVTTLDDLSSSVYSNFGF